VRPSATARVKRSPSALLSPPVAVDSGETVTVAIGDADSVGDWLFETVGEWVSETVAVGV
jgi:hypothetical protein